MKTFVAISGMFRSGTTLLSAMLNAHPNACSSADSYQPVLKEFRNAVARDVYRSFRREWKDPQAPLGDYYFDESENTLFRKIQETPFSISARGVELESLRRAVADYAKGYSPKITGHLDRLEGGTYEAIFRSAFDIVEKAYGEGKVVTHQCTKLVWSDEFIPHFLRAFPNSRVINVIRDPRAVCASRNVYDEKYPWIFLARQWRKLATFSWMIQNKWLDLKSRVLLVRYEDLIREPEAHAKQIAAFLGLEDHLSLIDAKKFTGGDGQPWHQNSSYYADEKGPREFNPKSIDKWKKILKEDEISLIEQLCLPEMLAWNYEPIYANRRNFPESLVDKPPVIPRERLSGWIKEYFTDDKVAAAHEMRQEQSRFAALTDSKQACGVEAKRRYFLFEEFFDFLKASLCNSTGDAGGESSFARSPNASYGRGRKSPAGGRTRRIENCN